MTSQYFRLKAFYSCDSSLVPFVHDPLMFSFFRHSPTFILPCFILTCLLLFLTLPPDVLASSLSFPAYILNCLLLFLTLPPYVSAFCSCLILNCLLLFLTLPPDVLATSPINSCLLLFMLASSFSPCLLMSFPHPPSVPAYSSLCLLPLSHPAS